MFRYSEQVFGNWYHLVTIWLFGSDYTLSLRVWGVKWPSRPWSGSWGVTCTQRHYHNISSKCRVHKCSSEIYLSQKARKICLPLIIEMRVWLLLKHNSHESFVLYIKLFSLAIECNTPFLVLKNQTHALKKQ